MYATDEKGFVNFFKKSQKIKGDESYINEIGNPTCPLGSVTIKETKAPEGYCLNLKKYKKIY